MCHLCDIFLPDSSPYLSISINMDVCVCVYVCPSITLEPLAVLPLLEVLLEGLFWNGVQLYEVLAAVKRDLFSGVLNLGNSQK
jgi:hypothetical protein